MNNIYLSPRTITLYLLKTVGFLIALHIFSMCIKFIVGYKSAFGLVPMFDFNAEKNLPTLYSFLAILFCSSILWLLSTLKSEKEKKNKFYWVGLCFIFIFLGLDEFFVIHEGAINISRELLSGYTTNSYLYYAWFIPYCAVFIFIAVFYVKFFFRLPANTRLQFILAAATFVAGAVGMEMIGGRYYSAVGESDVIYTFIYTLEETLEMLGIIIFIYSLSSYYILSSGSENIKTILHFSGEMNNLSIQSEYSERVAG